MPRRVDELAVARGRRTAGGELEALGVHRRNPGWNEAGVSRLWRFNLHYFAYVRDLIALAAAGDRSLAYDTFRRLVSSWIAAHRTTTGDGWHPYPLSLRIVNWCEAMTVFSAELEDDAAFERLLAASLYGQARFLRRHLEHDVRGNHLIKNAVGLLWAGTLFADDEARSWQRIGRGVLRRELEQQVLGDGAHCERVPGYHVQVLSDLDATVELFRSIGEDSLWLEAIASRMRRFLATISDPRGRLPLLKDTAESDVRELVGSSPRLAYGLMRESGFAVIGNEEAGDHLIADFGAVCADHLPAHAHADAFNFELTIGGRPTVVDSGVFEYEAGPWRDWFRSTAAHNTVEVEGGSQSDVWGSFRLGDRARVTDVSCETQGELVIVRGCHDGYSPTVHRRTLIVHPRWRVWVVVDELHGGSPRSVRSLLHLHPDLPADEPHWIALGPARIGERTGWYSGAFGTKTANRVVVLESESPTRFGYALMAGTNVNAALCGDRLELSVGADRPTLQVCVNTTSA